MKIRHAWPTTLLLATVCLLLVMTVLFLVAPRITVDLVQILIGEEPL